MNADAVRVIIKRAVSDIGSAKAWATKNDLSAAYVSDVLNGRRDPAERICAAVGIDRIVDYRPKSRRGAGA